MAKKNNSNSFVTFLLVISAFMFMSYSIDYVLCFFYQNGKMVDAKIRINTLSKAKFLPDFIKDPTQTIDVVSNNINFNTQEYSKYNDVEFLFSDADSTDLTSVLFSKTKRLKNQSNGSSANKFSFKFKASNFNSGKLHFKHTNSAYQFISPFKQNNSYIYNAQPSASSEKSSTGIIYLNLDNNQNYNSTNHIDNNSYERTALLHFLGVNSTAEIRKNAPDLRLNTNGFNSLFADNIESNEMQRIGIDPGEDPGGEPIPVGDGMAFMIALMGIYTLCRYLLFPKGKIERKLCKKYKSI